MYIYIYYIRNTMHEFSDKYELLSLINVSYPACRFIKNLNIDPSYTFAEKLNEIAIREKIKSVLHIWR